MNLFQSIKNPLQLMGFYLFLVESALTISQFALQGVEHWTKSFLLFTMGFGLLVYIGTASYLLIKLVNKNPQFLFNPSDYDSKVQPLLFQEGSKLIKMENPPKTINEN